MCLFGPELANLHPNDQSAWKIYLTAKEAGFAVLCGYIGLILKGRVPRNLSWAVGLIFMTQAVDEALDGNVITDHKYEYAVEAGFLLLIWFLTKRYPGVHDQSQ